MLHRPRLIMMVLVASFIVAVPSAMAQTPTTNQYQPTAPVAGPPGPAGTPGAVGTPGSPGADGAPGADGGGSLPDDDAGAPDEGGSLPADDAAAAPVTVRRAAPAAAGKLPFTGGQLSLIALIGLGLLALGLVGHAVTRKRGASAVA